MSSPSDGIRVYRFTYHDAAAALFGELIVVGKNRTTGQEQCFVEMISEYPNNNNNHMRLAAAQGIPFLIKNRTQEMLAMF